MALNINIDQVSSLQSDIQNVKENTTTTYSEISDLSSTISGNWSSSGSDAFIKKYNTFVKNFDNYTDTLSSINKYVTNTKEEFLATQEKVKNTLET